MPSVDNWMCKPLDIVQNIYEKYGGDSDKHIREHFEEKIKHHSSAIPSLNDVSPQDLRSGTLVRYRGMVQDMHDPEFYLGAYEVTSNHDNRATMMCGKYRDITQCPTDCSLNLDSPSNVTCDRLTLYCVPVPGENAWTKHIYKEKGPTTSICPPNMSSTKRGIDGCHGDIADDSNADDSKADMLTTLSDGKKVCNGDEAKAVSNEKNQKPSTDLNFPLPGETGVPCLVKVYDDPDTYKVNDLVEFVGVFCADPSLAGLHDDVMQIDDYIDPVEAAFPEEKQAKCPPASLVPRLHVIVSYPLKHNNPLLPQNLDAKDVPKDKTAATKQKLVSILKHAVFDDALAAEYLLCNILSSVYSRKDVMPLGKASVNLINAPRTPQYAVLLHHLISNITTHSHMLAMSLDNMNKSLFSPHKDYTTNRLCTGVLQLCAGTNIVVDETALQPGQLDVKGVKNISALGTLITWQKVTYDFQYHTQDFMADVGVVVLSEGTSLLPSDYRVPLAPQYDPTDLTQYFNEIDSQLTHETLDDIRRYITTMKQLTFTMDSDVQKAIQEDFVEARKDDVDNMTVDDFHSLLNLVRLLSLSEGSFTGSLDLWAKAKQMETDRKQRVLLLPRPLNSQ